MAEGGRDGPPVVDYEPAGKPGERRQLATGYLAALLIAVVLVAGSSSVGSWIDTRGNPSAEAAGLIGMLVGGAIGIALVIAAAAAALVTARRRHNAVLRGVGQGLLLMLGVVALMAGICAVVG